MLSRSCAAARRALGPVLLLILIVGLAAPAWAEPVDEAKIGAEAAAQLEKEVKVVDNPTETARLTEIANRLGAVSQRPEVKYTVKILQSKEINAFSIPGGHLYITQGTLDVVESEDEVAAVLAHEVAHNAKRHSLESMKKESRAQTQIGLAVLAAVLAGQQVDAGNVMLFAGLLKVAVVNSYSRKAESEADREAIGYLRAAKYNPVAMLTVVEGLAKIEGSRPRRDPGVLQSHPYGSDRAKAVVARLRELGIELNRRPVLRSLTPSVEATKQSELELGVLKLDTTPLFSVAPAGGVCGVARANAMAEALRKALLQNLQVYELLLAPAPPGMAVVARGQPVITILPEDATAAGTTVGELAQRVTEGLQLAFWREAVQRGY